MADGNIEFLGRRDQQVKVNGNRIELNEIKHVIEGHPSVRNAAIGITDSSAGDRIIVARFQAMPGTPGDMGTALKRWLVARLPAYMVPTFCIQADQLPLSENGKAYRKGYFLGDGTGAGKGRQIAACILDNWLAGWAVVMTFCVMYFVRLPNEEAMMLSTFGKAYEDYMSETGRLFPFAK